MEFLQRIYKVRGQCQIRKSELCLHLEADSKKYRIEYFIDRQEWEGGDTLICIYAIEYSIFLYVIWPLKNYCSIKSDNLFTLKSASPSVFGLTEETDTFGIK